MILNYFKTAFRNIVRKRFYYLIQIFGFALALSCVILILSWVRYENSFDKFHINGDRICRILMKINQKSENGYDLAIVPPPLSEAIQDEFPEIELATRFEFCPKVVFKYKGDINFENRGAFADPAFLEIFSFQLMKGNSELALTNPQSIILSESLAEKYFSNKDPLNKVITVEELPFTVTGIMRDLPPNSHLQFDFLLPVQVKELFGSDLNDWGNVNLFSYVLLAKNVNFTRIDQKIRNWKTPRKMDQFFLQPLFNIHRESGIQADEVVVSDHKYISLFIVLAFAILAIACINFLNLQTAQVLQRTKEVGIRKVVGAARSELIKQLMIESSLVLLLSYLLSFILAEILLPFFKQLFNYMISLHFYDISFLSSLILLYFLIIILTGIIPSNQFASFRPIGLLRNTSSKGKKRSLLRNLLVILQFSFSVFFIIGTMIIHQQFRFMKESSLNNHQEEIIYLPFKGDIGSNYEVFKNNLLVHASIENVTAKNSMPSQVADKTGEMDWPGKDRNQDFIIEATGIDPDYFNTLGINMIEGRGFTETYASKGLIPFILNETALKRTGLTNPIGTRIKLWGYPGEITGIVRDVQLKSLKDVIEGQVFYPIQDYTDQEMTDFGVILIELKDNIQDAIALIEQEWHSINPGTPFEYHFLEEAVDSMYWEENRLSLLMNYASILSVVICCLGLLGLVVYNSSVRIKEIGIRKINGASMLNIMAMMNKDYMQWVFISYLITLPVAWQVLHQWLQNFAYQVPMNGWIFILTGLLILFITLVTVNSQIITVARRNPAEILRYE